MGPDIDARSREMTSGRVGTLVVMSEKVFGENPMPRALIVGFDDATTEALSRLFAHARTYESGDAVRSEEYDVLVTNGSERHVPSHFDVVTFGQHFGAADAKAHNDEPLAVLFEGVTHAREFKIASGLHPDLAALVERVLLPKVQASDVNPVLSTHPIDRFAGLGGYTPVRYESLDPDEAWVKPFLCTTEPRVLAAAITRTGGRSEAWCLPEELNDDPVPWVKAAVRVWHERNPTRFPHDPGWPSDRRWMTRDETRLLDAIDTLEVERSSYVTESEERERALRDELRVAQDAAESGARRLLTAQGDDLVAAVITALERLGFDVEDRDKLVQPGEPRLEDLRVTVPGDDPDWVALVEVKGRSGGAAVGDLLKLGRFVENFIEAEGRRPSRRWYVVNQFIGLDPVSRQPILHGSEGDLAVFERQDGMAMDTTQLFDLVRSVEDGMTDAAEARHHLMAQLGRYAAPS
jgi:hypothetical protein